MSTWAYSAINAQGIEFKGEIEAPDVNAAREQLRNRGLMPSALRQVGATASDGESAAAGARARRSSPSRSRSSPASSRR